MKSIVTYILVFLSVTASAQSPIKILLHVNSSSRLFVTGYFNRHGYGKQIGALACGNARPTHITEYYVGPKTDFYFSFVGKDHFRFARNGLNKYLSFRTSNDTVYTQAVNDLVSLGFTPITTINNGDTTTTYTSKKRLAKIDVSVYKTSTDTHYSFYYSHWLKGY